MCIASVVAEELGWRRVPRPSPSPHTLRVTTDIPALSNWGEPLLLGPGTIHVAHTPFEKIAKRELLEAVDLYFDLAQRLAR